MCNSHCTDSLSFLNSTQIVTCPFDLGIGTIDIHHGVGLSTFTLTFDFQVSPVLALFFWHEWAHYMMRCHGSTWSYLFL